MPSSRKLLLRFQKFVSDNRLIKRRDSILVGFSGGADSTALIHLLWSLKKTYQINIIAAHVNYKLRGEESEGDMAYCRDFCFSHNIPLVIKECDLSGRIAGLEDFARKVRFEYFQEIKRVYAITSIALGHNKEDVAETMLLHLFRGSGIKGLRGIQPQNNDLIRPLICFSRNELECYLSDNNILNWRKDSSNDGQAFTRNRLRNCLIPIVKKEINSKVVEMLYDNSEIFQEAELLLVEQAKKLKKKVLLKQSAKEIRLDVLQLRKSTRIVRYYLLRLAVETITGTDNNFYHGHFKEIESILHGNGSKYKKLYGKLVFKKEYDELSLSLEGEGVISDLEQVETMIEPNKRYQIVANTRLHCQKVIPAEITEDLYNDPNIALIDADKIVYPMKIGFRKAGERFIPLGMKGTKKLKDFFIDEKISKFERDKLLIVRDCEKVVWLVSIRLDERVKVSEETKTVLLLRVENLSPRSRRSAQRIDKGKR